MVVDEYVSTLWLPCLSSLPCQGGFKFTVTFSKWPDEAGTIMCLWLPRHYLAWLQNTEAGVLAPPWNMSLQVLESAKQCFLWGCRSDMGSACPWVAAIARNICGIACGWGTPNVSDSWDVRPWNPLTAFWVWGNWGLDTNIVEHSGLSCGQGASNLNYLVSFLHP